MSHLRSSISVTGSLCEVVGSDLIDSDSGSFVQLTQVKLTRHMQLLSDYCLQLVGLKRLVRNLRLADPHDDVTFAGR